MTLDRKAQLATLLVMAALGAAVLWRQGAFDRAVVQTAEPQPQDPIYAALDAVRSGDLRKYVAAHTGVMETSLLRAAAEVGDDRFMKSLQEKNAPLKGIAILEPERVSEREVKATVEYVFADRNEVQTYFLEKRGDVWKIARVQGAGRIQTLIPYGSPAN